MRLKDALKNATDACDTTAVATLRLIKAALKERDFAARNAGKSDGLSDDELLDMLSAMVTQRHEEIGRCESCGQLDLAEKEAEEIAVIEAFLPARMDGEELVGAVDQVIRETGASKQKDTGRVMTALKSRFTGRMNFAEARRLVQDHLH